MCLFFYDTAYSEKKNSSYAKGAEKIFYNEKKNKQTGTSGDIISYNNKNRNYINDEESDDKKELVIEKGVESGGKNNLPDTGTTKYKYYVVKKGDTLFSIAKRSRLSLKALLEFNNLKENSSIYAGMKLKIPCNKSVKIVACKSADKKSTQPKPLFSWPLKKIKGYSNDGKDGVKSIGIIIKGNPGSEVVASEKGVVKRVGYMRGFGKYIVVKHENRYITVYSNLMDVNVRVGDMVQKGVKIGNISDDMTLHFQIDHQGKPENPLKLLPGRG